MTRSIQQHFPAETVISEQRLATLDILRGVAVLGILWVNILVFGLPAGGYALPSYLGTDVSANVTFWAFSELMVDGAMRGLLSCLFGAGALIFLSEYNLQTQGVLRIEYYYRRNLILIAIGLIHSYLLLWPYDVLFAYGLIGLFLFPLKRIPAKPLVLIACLLIWMTDLTIIEPIASKSDSVAEIAGGQAQPVATSNARQSDDVQEDDDPIAAEYARKDEYHTYAVMAMKDDIALQRSSYPQLFLAKLEITIEQHTAYMYTVNIYDIGGMMLLGMALLKLGILQGHRSRRFYAILMLAGFAIGIAMRLPGIMHELASDFVPENVNAPNAVNSNFSRLPIMLGYIGLFLFLYKLRIFSLMFRALTAVGKMALTNYLMQTVICIFLFYGVGFGLIGELQHYQLGLLCIAIWIVLGLFSLVWLKYFRSGPLEWLWRCAIYLRWQAIRRDTQV